MAVTDALRRDLGGIVGPSNVLTAADVVAGYVVDWTGRFTGAASAVVRPRTTEEVAGVVRWCVDAGVAIVPQGGNTGLVGGGVPRPLDDPTVVMSTRLLDACGPVDVAARAVTAEAGVTVAALQESARGVGLDYAVDLGSRGSATVGGTIATNAGGLRVVRYGNTRAQLLGIEAVLGNGTIVSHLGGLPKDNTGYDLAGLLCGSEGTLGVVTRARLRLIRPARFRATALVAFETVDAAVGAGLAWAHDVEGVEAVELVLRSGLELVVATLGLDRPFRVLPAAAILVEVGGGADPIGVLGDAVAATPGVLDAAVATDPERRRGLWRYREGHTEAINTLGAPHKCDVTLPADRLAAFIDVVPDHVASRAPGAQVWLFGHVGDGNIHVNITGVDPGDDTIDGTVFALVADLDGSISAEHGIGVAKRRWLGLNRSPAELAAFRAIKQALDPAGILNPGVIIDR